MAQALYDQVLAGRSRQHIDPAYSGVRDVVQVRLIVDLVVAAHSGNKVVAVGRSGDRLAWAVTLAMLEDHGSGDPREREEFQASPPYS